ncbi:hypothetical protein BC830DRAFT_1090735 [Chytriomyces sp. MP71]|nr:hypothetical protein BC830DRAFT_1090735 [Chytriomyces sp. MP71]
MPKGRKTFGKSKRDGNKSKKNSKGAKPFVPLGAKGGAFFTASHEHLIAMQAAASDHFNLTMSGPPPKLAQEAQSSSFSLSSSKGGKDQKVLPVQQKKSYLTSGTPTFSGHSELLRQALLSTSSPQLRTLQRFKKHHGILLVGEGDFSFTEALCKALDISKTNLSEVGKIIATSYDTVSDVSAKYGTDATDRLRVLKHLAPRVQIQHKVDATTMSTTLIPPAANGGPNALPLLHRIVFNFPHAGGGTPRDVKLNRIMLDGFFAQARVLLALSLVNATRLAKKRGGEVAPPGVHEFQVLVSLRQTPFYDMFDVTGLAERNGFVVRERTRFDGERWTALGYKPQRTNPAQREAPGWENAELFVFALENAGAFSVMPLEEIEPVGAEGGEGDEDDEEGSKKKRQLAKKGNHPQARNGKKQQQINKLTKIKERKIEKRKEKEQKSKAKKMGKM